MEAERQVTISALKLFKELEAADLRRVESLKRGQLVPLEPMPQMPLYRPAGPKPPAVVGQLTE